MLNIARGAGTSTYLKIVGGTTQPSTWLARNKWRIE